MLAVQPRGGLRTNKELAAICVWPCVGHGHGPRLCVAQLEVFITERGAVDRLSTSAIATLEVSTLQADRSYKLAGWLTGWGDTRQVGLPLPLLRWRSQEQALDALVMSKR